MNKNTRMVLIILSIVAVLNVMFIPIFDVWGGLFPSDVDRDFFDVMECYLENDNAWNLWVVQLTISFFASSILMLITSLIGNKKLSIVANIIAIFVWFKLIVIDYVEEEGTEALLDSEDGSISIGTWITIILFIASFVVVLKSKKKDETCQNIITPRVEQNITENTISCSSCGAIINEGCIYCNRCGTKVKLSPTDNENLKFQSLKSNVCPNCNIEVDENAAFCTNCGTKL